MNSEYLQKYLLLPPETKEQISTSENREIFNQLEKEYHHHLKKINHFGAEKAFILGYQGPDFTIKKGGS